MEAPGPPTNTIFCLYCRATIYFPGLPANRYTNHLFAEHNIMYEVQSVINRTLALQLPKEYPELADGSMSLPDSSNRLNSPAPSSVGGPSPAPGPSIPQGGVVSSPATSQGAESYGSSVIRPTVYFTETSTQTDEVTICNGGCKESKQTRPLEPNGGKVENEAEIKTETTELEKKRGKESSDERVKEEVKRMLEKAGKNKKLGVSCEICKVRYKKMSKLKFHIIKQHSKEIIGKLRSKGDPDPKKDPHVPERKSSRIELKKEEEKGEGKQDIKSNINNCPQDIPDSLIVPKDEEWTEGCRFFCMLCSSSFTSFGVYKHHIGNFHAMLIEEYRAKFGKHGEIISKINCKLCGSEVVHRNSAIKGHLKTIHNLTLAEYKNRFIESSEADVDDEMEIDDKEPDDEDDDEEEVGDGEGQEVVQEEGETKVAEVERVQPSVGKGQVDAGVGQVEAGVDQVEAGEGELRRWYEGCNYVCIPCNKEIY